MDKTLVTISGIGVIGFIYWFFFGKKEEASTQTTIRVSGGYKPAAIRIPLGKPTTLTFTRTDPNPCLEELIIPDFKIKEFLPMNKPVSVTISPTKPGTYGIHCGMNMFHGRIEVV